MQGRKLVGVGIDLVSRKRIERFLSEHPFESIKRLLTPSEQERFQTAASPRDFFARLFAAKEACFKATGGAGMGEEGFRGVEIEMEGRGQFCAKQPSLRGVPPEGRDDEAISGLVDCFVPPLRGGTRNDAAVEGRFFPTPDGIGAQVLIWQ